MQTQLINNKKLQRKDFLQKRRALTKEQRQEYSRHIVKNVMNLSLYQQAKMCFLFASMPDEVQTKELILDALKAGKRVCLPYITDKKHSIMEACEIFSLDELVKGEYGILSVDENNIRLINPKEFDFVLVPAVGFDRAGYRLGMGGGYYDRYLARAVNAKKIAGIYSCQLADTIAKDDYDAQVDMIFTEKEIIKCK